MFAIISSEEKLVGIGKFWYFVEMKGQTVMSNSNLEIIVKRLGEALCQVKEQQLLIKQQELKIKILEARLAKTQELNTMPPARPWRTLGGRI